MNVAQLTVEKLKIFGVSRIYGLVGTSILDLVDAIKDSGIRYISTRHDQSAVSMAVAEGKITGAPGVAVVHGGPGFLNSLTAIAVAYKDSLPCVVIAGAVKRRLRGLDSWLEVDQLQIANSIVKAFFSLQKPSDAESTLSLAFESAATPPCGPALVEVPEDVWRLDAGVVKDGGFKKGQRRLPDKADVDRVLDLLKKSKSPVLLAGGGINDEEGSSLLMELVDRFQIPVATTGNGRGVLPEDHELSLGRAGYGGGNTVSDFALGKADLVFSVGAGLSDVTTYAYNALPRGEIVAVTLDQLSSNKPIPYSMISNSDAKLFLKMMLENREHCRPESWMEEINNQRLAWNSLLDDIASRSPKRTANPSKFFKVLDSHLPRDAIITAGQGLHILYAYAYLKARKFASFLAATNLGAMGYAFPAALGAKSSFPQRMVLSVLGDGEFLMTLSDLETAVREKLGVRIVIVNDNSYRVLYMRQKIQKMGRVFGTVHSNPDIPKLAEAYGMKGMTLENDQKIDEAIDFLLSSNDEPCLLELRIDPEDLPPFNVEASLKF